MSPGDSTATVDFTTETDAASTHVDDDGDEAPRSWFGVEDHCLRGRGRNATADLKIEVKDSLGNSSEMTLTGITLDGNQCRESAICSPPA